MFTKILKRTFIILGIIIMPISASLAGQAVSYGKDYKGYLAVPINAKDAPAILLIHEWWGLTQEIKDKADKFAAEGYVALAVDMYGKPATDSFLKARKMSNAVRKDMPAAFKNLSAGIAFLKNHKGVDSTRIASVGWCFGGGWSYQIARNNLGVKASIIYYGQFNPEDDLQKMRATILGHFAEKDRFIKVDDVNAFEVKLKTLDSNHQVFIYPNTSHGFTNPTSKIYDVEASAKAAKRTLEFLKRVL